MSPRTLATMIQILELWRDGGKHKGERSYWITLRRPGSSAGRSDLDPKAKASNVLVQVEFEDGALHEQTFEDDARVVAQLAEMLTR